MLVSFRSMVSLPYNRNRFKWPGHLSVGQQLGIYPCWLFLKFRMTQPLSNAHDTHNANSWDFWLHKFAAISPSIHCNAFPVVPCTLQAFFIANLQTSQFYHSTNLFIAWFLCSCVLQLVETAVCFTICMIQCVFSILIYSFNHICIKLPWIEDKHQQHFYSTEVKSIVGIKIKVVSSLVNFTLFIKIWEITETGSIPTTGWVLSNLITFLLKLSIEFTNQILTGGLVYLQKKSLQYVSGTYICYHLKACSPYHTYCHPLGNSIVQRWLCLNFHRCLCIILCININHITIFYDNWWLLYQYQLYYIICNI